MLQLILAIYLHIKDLKFMWIFDLVNANVRSGNSNYGLDVATLDVNSRSLDIEVKNHHVNY